ncbi:MAG TPA: LysR family transcriptional regulator [Candidatus Sulfotelmatobacter sp.]|nr:LysR family transcriptional regulator [Candidatus Sulfotelmatobacter sp.]
MNTQGWDLNLLYVFQALMTERSVTRAAAWVGLSQPALSNALNRLRNQFSDRLFVPGRKTMVPTPRALELAPHIDAALRHVRSTVRPPEFHPESSTRTFRIATTDEIELVLFPVLTKALSAAAPGITVNCARVRRLSAVPDPDLQSGTLDCAIGEFPDAAAIESGRFAMKLYERKYVCIARAGHPFVGRRLTIAQFCKLNHVVTYYPGVGPGLIDRLLAENGHRRLVRLSLPHFLTLPFVVAGSDLVATVPDLVARAVGGPLRLRIVPCPVPIPRIPVSLVWHMRTQEDAAHDWFRNLIVNVSQKLVRNVAPRAAVAVRRRKP